MSIDLQTQLGTLTLRSPVVLAAGPWYRHIIDYAMAGIGAATTNSFGPRPRDGHPEPRIYDWGDGLINAVGLNNIGAEAAVPFIREMKQKLAEDNVILIVSMFGETARNFGEVGSMLAQADPDIVEVNISCPNVEHDFGIPFATDATAAAEATAAAREALGCMMAVKLAPNVPNLLEIAAGVIAAGADILTASNTMPGMVIDTETRTPVITNRVGGVSGQAVRPIAVRMVYELRKAFADVPILGTGGVTQGVHAVEMLMAGADAVGLASVAVRSGVEGVAAVQSEFKQWLTDHNTDPDAIRGAVHRSEG